MPLPQAVFSLLNLARKSDAGRSPALSAFSRPARGGLVRRTALACGLALGAALPAAAQAEPPPPPLGWEGIGRVSMRGGLRIFWNVGGKDREANEREALARGFEPVDLLNTYSDYPGKQREKIIPDGKNPWAKPPQFERVIRRNIAMKQGRGLFVHDIEFDFDEEPEALWTNPVLRAASGAATLEAFREAYYREWGTWYTLPCRWAKEAFPHLPVGIYGPQPFRRDYWGLSGKDAQQIDGTHKTDAELWRHIDPAVDFCIASLYCFYDRPASVFYMGANVEENALRMARNGDKPLYAYLWLRYHNSNKKLGTREVDDYLAESMAILPFFCGARGVVLWGWEPAGTGQPYRTLPLFMKSLGRVAGVSEELGRARPAQDEPVHAAWKAQRPLVRRLRVTDNVWLVLAADPWQEESAERTVRVSCGAHTFDLAVRGKHTEIYRIDGGNAERR